MDRQRQAHEGTERREERTGPPPGRPEPSHDPRPSSGAPRQPEHVRVAIVGSGFGGLGAAVRLRQEGITDFVVLERADAVGGTWRDNSYPGAACDVPSHLYSYSFAPNPDWKRAFSPQADIRAYTERVTEVFGLRPHLRLRHEVRRLTWDDDALLWRIETTGADFTADVVVSATGPLSDPSLPDVPGLDGFPGEVFHSSRWNHGTDLRGKRVAVIGTGASAVQIVPRIQPGAASLTVFQRTPPWVLPKLDRPITAAERLLHRHVPLTATARRTALWAVRELQVRSFTSGPGGLRPAEALARAHLARHIKDPGLRAALTPSYRMGCKRILLSNDYYPALTRPNTTVVASGLAEVRGSTLVADDGTTTEADVIVFGTGFRVTSMPVAERVFGADGASLAEAWDQGMRSLRGTAVDGFPNLLTIIGPNTGLGNSSMILMIESQLNYLADFLRQLRILGGRTALAARPEAVAAWGDFIERRLERSIWTTGNCRSWYLDRFGRNTTLWPGTTGEFRRLLREVDLGEYEIIRAPSPSAPSTPSTTAPAPEAAA
ncbi:flavin-containing monooxygenase [Streptomyces qinzhouensis]|uniref:NAD(P)/FAD-dependent oxidoreductase n=1 Tax=Streptomyces qinzhouensis TaxID=2599401 RepID=A0A5B8IIJ8_9ACTN|nr:NAD(P)/FAD-dependent oxidoreductase [Streptomyces qinzhouensis]QDY77209.1 NAD(P)/FAD-dependent oxidoreductase [Streptomyces qinzhouensis]